MPCWYVRWRLSSQLDGGSPSARVAAHVAACDACRAHEARLAALHGQLARGAATAPIPGRLGAPSPVGRRIAWLGVATAAAALVVLRLVPGHAPAPPPPQQHAALATGSAGSAQLVAPPPAVASLAAPRALAVADQLIDAAPLQHELGALESDTLRGARVALRVAITATDR